MNLIWLFPGQSSRYAGMLDKLSALSDAGPQTLDQACTLLGRDLAAENRGPAAYERNRDIQVAVFLANLLCQQALEERGLRASMSLGLSLGQYNHLVHIGALAWTDALELVDARGRAYDEGPSGAMASIQPVALEELRTLLGDRCGTPGRDGDLEIVNRNSPRQQVIAGETLAVERACELLEQEHYLSAIVIERKIPMHASRFEPVARAMGPALAAARFHAVRAPYICNTNAFIDSHPSPQKLRESLAAHVHSPVLWQRSIEAVVDRVAAPVFVEVGPMGVLSSLLHRRWMPVQKFKCDAREDVQDHFERTVQALRALTARTSDGLRSEGRMSV